MGGFVMDGTVTLDSVQKIVAPAADENFNPHLPAKTKPVSLRRNLHVAPGSTDRLLG